MELAIKILRHRRSKILNAIFIKDSIKRQEAEQLEKAIKYLSEYKEVEYFTFDDLIQSNTVLNTPATYKMLLALLDEYLQRESTVEDYKNSKLEEIPTEGLNVIKWKITYFNNVVGYITKTRKNVDGHTWEEFEVLKIK